MKPRRRRVVRRMVIAMTAVIVGLGLMVAVIAPGLGLLAAWRWSHTRAEPSPPAAPRLETTTPTDEPLIEMRRIAHAVIWDRSDAAATALADDLRSIDDSLRCATLLVDGVTVAGSGDEVVIAPNAAHRAIIAAVALDVLGPDHRFTTEIRGNPIVAGVHNGDLFLVGGGDPVLVTADFPAQWGTALLPVTALDALVDQLVAQGLTTVTGDLVGDARRYDSEYTVATWEIDGRVAPHAALLVNRGVLFGASYGLNPVQSAVNELNRQLTVRGIAVEGRNRSLTAGVDGPEELEVLARVESVPLETIVDALLETGDATIAELLLKEIGLVARGSGSRSAGVEVVAESVRGWDPDAQAILIDGSGRSPGSQADCAAIAQSLDRLQRAGHRVELDQLTIAEGEQVDAIVVGSGPTAITAVIVGTDTDQDARRVVEQYAQLLASIDRLAERLSVRTERR